MPDAVTTSPGTRESKRTPAIMVSVLYFALFGIVAFTTIGRTYPTDYNSLFYGLTHGLFFVPTLIASLFFDSISVYQTPNDGWYNVGYAFGLSLFAGGYGGVIWRAIKA